MTKKVKLQKRRSRARIDDTPNQAKITTFFRPKPICTETPFDATCNQRSEVSKSLKQDSEQSQGYGGPSTPPETMLQEEVVENKVEPRQQSEPPTWTTPTAAGQQAHGTNRQPRPRWLIDLSARFDELAAIRHPATGPELDVDVWYVHHVRHPECVAPRTVRLDNLRDLWYADLCAIWWDHVDPHSPVRIDVVTPTQSLLVQTTCIHSFDTSARSKTRTSCSSLHSCFSWGPQKGPFSKSRVSS